MYRQIHGSRKILFSRRNFLDHSTAPKTIILFTLERNHFSSDSSKSDLEATRILLVRQTIPFDNRSLCLRTRSDSADVAARSPSRSNRPFRDLSRTKSTVHAECLWCPGLYQSGSQAVRGLLMGYELWSFAVVEYYYFLFLARAPSRIRGVSIRPSHVFFYSLYIRFASPSLSLSLPVFSRYCKVSSFSLSLLHCQTTSEGALKDRAGPGRPLLLPSTSKQHLKFWHFRRR